MRPDGSFVPGRVGRRAALVAQARPYGLFFGPCRAGGTNGLMGRDSGRVRPGTIPQLSPPPSLRQDLHGRVGAAAAMTSSRICAQESQARVAPTDMKAEAAQVSEARALAAAAEAARLGSARPPRERRCRRRNRAASPPTAEAVRTPRLGAAA
jgi:hypothetical protein